MSDLQPPENYTLHTRVSPMTEPWSPIYRWDQPDRIYLGVHLREAHCNSRGLVHGGFIAALADNCMGYTAGQAMAADGRRVKGLVTVNLGVDYLGSAKLGQWMSWEPELIKATGTLAFVQAVINADGAVVARANATFKIID
ncbi:MAG: PaaI family thioesterase [Pseudomonadota bacterium]